MLTDKQLSNISQIASEADCYILLTIGKDHIGQVVNMVRNLSDSDTRKLLQDAIDRLDSGNLKDADDKPH